MHHYGLPVMVSLSIWIEGWMKKHLALLLLRAMVRDTVVRYKSTYCWSMPWLQDQEHWPRTHLLSMMMPLSNMDSDLFLLPALDGLPQTPTCHSSPWNLHYSPSQTHLAVSLNFSSPIIGLHLGNARRGRELICEGALILQLSQRVLPLPMPVSLMPLLVPKRH